MRDEEVILESLRTCSDYTNACNGCPYRKIPEGCNALIQDILELIAKLKKENESLKAELGTIWQKENESLKAELDAVSQALNSMKTK